jgi:hypothetical protein
MLLLASDTLQTVVNGIVIKQTAMVGAPNTQGYLSDKQQAGHEENQFCSCLSTDGSR